MSDRMDIVVTWPKSRSLESYLAELRKAEQEGLDINFRVSRLPTPASDLVTPPGGRRRRCYTVHDGAVRGYTEIKGFAFRDDVVNPITGGRFFPGHYIVRDPQWFPLDTPIPMGGFQGWRYFEENGP